MLIRNFITFVSLFLVILIPTAHPARSAQVTSMSDCQKSPFSGSWVSTDKSVPFLSKLDITDQCKQVTTQPVAANNPWAGALGRKQTYIYREYQLRPISSCSPVDCVWGRSKGVLNSKGAMTAQFRMFFSQRFLTLTWKKQALLVNWRIQYLSGKKSDQLGETLLVRAN